MTSQTGVAKAAAAIDSGAAADVLERLIATSTGARRLGSGAQVGMIEQLISRARAGRRGTPSRGLRRPSLESRLSGRGEDRPFNEALVRPGLSLIAEFKRRSPSAGEIAAPSAIGRRPGRCLSSAAARRRSRFSPTSPTSAARSRICARRGWPRDLPIIRKDFIVDPYQLYEAAVNGADAVLLIVRALGDAELRRLHEQARALDLDCLVEVHDAAELERALELDVEVIGINNRDLDQGTVDVATTYRVDARRTGRKDRRRRERDLDRAGAGGA